MTCVGSQRHKKSNAYGISTLLTVNKINTFQIFDLDGMFQTF